MMKLKFRIGAVVSFGLTCASNLITCGKVIHADNDEVVFIPQSPVRADEFNSTISTEITVADGTPIHLDRALIASWCYTQLFPNNRTTYCDIPSTSDLSKLSPDAITHYDANGICEGTGEMIDEEFRRIIDD